MINKYTLKLNDFWIKTKHDLREGNWKDADIVQDIEDCPEKNNRKYNCVLFIPIYQEEKNLLMRINDFLKDAEHGDLLKLKTKSGEEVYGVLYNKTN